MATLSPSVAIKDPKLGHGGSGVHPPVSDGGGDGRGDNGYPDYGARLRRARLGILLLLVTVTMLFVAFTSAYIFRQGLPVLDERSGKDISDWVQVNLPTGLLLINTLLLLVSSITAEFARRQITQQAALAPVQSIPGISIGGERSFPWLGITIVLGLGFLAGQWIAWRELQARGFYLATSPSSSFVYLLTAAHAIHLSGGILALLYAGVTSLFRRPVELRRIVVDITVWYWHFMALLWIYIFALLEFAH
jgi:cytochrome c oxidase subunit III